MKSFTEVVNEAKKQGSYGYTNKEIDKLNVQINKAYDMANRLTGLLSDAEREQAAKTIDAVTDILLKAKTKTKSAKMDRIK